MEIDELDNVKNECHCGGHKCCHNDIDRDNVCDCEGSEDDIKSDSNCECEEKIKKLNAELASAKDKYLRLCAEFDNFRRRSQQEKVSIIENASKSVIMDILPIVDDFERALSAMDIVDEGVKIISDKLNQILNKYEVTVIETKRGDDFDSNKHYAIVKQPVEDSSLRGKVVDVIERGYMLHSAVLRYSKVIVGE